MLGWLRRLFRRPAPPPVPPAHKVPDPENWDDGGWPSRPGRYDPPDAIMFPCDCSPNVPMHMWKHVRIRHAPGCNYNCMSIEICPDELGRIAARFRAARDQTGRTWAARDYEYVVQKLIESGQWHEMPPPEDQLPCAYMPPCFTDHFGGDPCRC